MLKIELPADIKFLEKIFSFIHDFAEKYNIDNKLINKLQLIVEEIVVNICSYAYPNNSNGKFAIEISKINSGKVKIKFEDWGIPFDPTKKEVKQLKNDVVKADIGGLGLHLVKSLSKELKYKRENNKNILEILV